MKARKVAKKTEPRKNKILQKVHKEKSENKIKWNIKDGILSQRMKKYFFLCAKREKHVKVKPRSQSECVRMHTACSIYMDINTEEAKKLD